MAYIRFLVVWVSWGVEVVFREVSGEWAFCLNTLGFNFACQRIKDSLQKQLFFRGLLPRYARSSNIQQALRIRQMSGSSFRAVNQMVTVLYDLAVGMVYT